MKRKKNYRRAVLIAISFSFLSIATSLALLAFKDTATLYMSPTEVLSTPPGNKIIRIGGLVAKGSIKYTENNNTVEFIISDLKNSIKIKYSGIIPNLFKEGKGAVAKGYLKEDGIFVSSELLAKHDENYMPPEVTKSLSSPST